MANEEGVKIVITAEDRFTENIKKIEASTKIFGETAKNTEKHLAALEKEMIRLVANGMDPANKKIVEMKSNYDKLGQSLNTGEGALKKSNQQWNSLALVIQDLPFGFRGIQNNLPALIGGIAGVGGAAYVAFSAIIAIYTAYGQQINDAISQTTNFQKAQKELGKSTIEAAKSTEDERKQLYEVTAVIEAARNGFINQADAVQYFNNKLGDSIGKVGSLSEAEQALIDKAPKYIEALMLKAKAEYYFAKASEFAVKKDIAGLEDQTSALDKLLVLSKTISKFAEVTSVRDIVKTLISGIGQAQKEGVDKVTKTAGEISGILNEEGKKAMSAYFEALKKSGLTDAEIKAIVDRQNKIIKQAQDKANKERLDDIKKANEAIDKANESETNAFIRTLDERGQKEYKAGLELVKSLEVMEAAGFTDSITYYTAYRTEMSNIAKYYDDKETEEQKKKQEKIAKEQEKFGKSQVDILNSELSVKLKLNKDNLIGQQNAVTESMAKVGALMVSAFGTGEFGPLLQYYDELNAKLEAMDQNALRGAEAMKKVNGILSNMANDTFIMFAENLGKALAGENIDIFGAFAEMMGSGLQEIGKALISYGLAMDAFKKAFTNPFAAVAAGIALVAAGAYLKSSISKTSGEGGSVPTFANGGIVSGPTMGLMGEYPGAKSNPEVIAPLDKLKDLIGGEGGGTFVLRGQDLLLSVNRAQKASNLKGQNINLV